MLKFATLDAFDKQDKNEKYVLFFLAFYLTDDCYYMDDFHYQLELSRMEFNKFGAVKSTL